ncbi:hypothetical protein [Pseudooceanicola atlanticus]|uniref:hypothetical protein n=1 Tax=Pseudooceanicola atlanticus TaxID=1461694 RepID=UPI0023552CBE|nr:hypothetical protein [Pseudooceanicola atlanticus]
MSDRKDDDKKPSPWLSDENRSPRIGRRSTDAPTHWKNAPQRNSEPNKIERQINLRTDVETAERFRYICWLERRSYSETLKLLLDTYDTSFD